MAFGKEYNTLILTFVTYCVQCKQHNPTYLYTLLPVSVGHAEFIFVRFGNQEINVYRL